MQNRAKMCASRSSGAVLPVISSSAARASCRSASTNSSGSGPPSARAAVRARDQRLLRALHERDVPQVRHRRASRAGGSSSERLDDASRSPSRPAPVFADTDSRAAPSRHAGGRSALVCDTRNLSRNPRDLDRPRSRPREPSSTSSTRSATAASALPRSRANAFRSTSSPPSRMPAVSTSVTRSPSRSTVSVTRSRVVPGTVGRRSPAHAPASALKRLDLPAFGAPDDRDLQTFADQAPAPRIRRAAPRVCAIRPSIARPARPARRSGSPPPESRPMPRAARSDRTASRSMPAIARVSVPSSWSNAARACSGVTASTRSPTASACTGRSARSGTRAA